MSAERPKLVALAERLGIASFYWDLVGNARPTRDATREALVAAMGFDGSGEAAAARALDAIERTQSESLIEPVLVWREFENAVPSLPLRLDASTGALISDSGMATIQTSAVRHSCPLRPARTAWTS